MIFKYYRNAPLASVIMVFAMLFFFVAGMMLIAAVVTLINSNVRDFLPMLITGLVFGGIWFLLQFIARKVAVRTWKKKGIVPDDYK